MAMLVSESTSKMETCLRGRASVSAVSVSTLRGITPFLWQDSRGHHHGWLPDIMGGRKECNV